MAHISVPGRLGKNAEAKDVKGISVVEFSVAETVMKGRMKQTQWYDCRWWGGRGVKLSEHLTKGKQVTVLGNFTTREYNGRTYLDIDVFDVALQGGGERRQQEGNNRHDEGTTADELDDALPF